MTTSGRRAARRPRPKRKSRGAARRRPSVTVIAEDRSWRSETGAVALVRRAGRAALAMGARHAVPGVVILLSNDEHLKALNRLFRGRNKPTNVLSFPADAKNYLGDVVIAHGVAAREAKNEGKQFAAHAAHLAAHGVLHLLGYDHEEPEDAAIMEALEVRIMAKLGVSDPYRIGEAA